METPKTVDRIRSTGAFGQFPGAVLAAVGHDTYILEAEVAKLVAEAEARGMERAAGIARRFYEKALQRADAASKSGASDDELEGTASAYGSIEHAIRAEAAAIRRAAEGEKT